MRKLFAFAAFVVALVVSSCSYDDTPVWDKLNDHEERITALEELCREMNSDIEALQDLVEALEKNDYITEVIDNGDGYTIKFTSGKSITIKNGKDGADGNDGANGENGADGKDGETPVIGVKEEGGIYYWTVNGEWLLDENGNKIKAVGTDGKDGENGANGEDGADGEDGANGADGNDGVTPELKIEDGKWYVSYDNGASWVELGVAVEGGEESAPVADSIFKSVTEDEGYVYFTLADGTEIKVAKAAALDIKFDVADAAVAAGETYEIAYTVEAAVEAVEIEAIAANNVANVEVVKEEALSGVIKVTVGDKLQTNSKVIVLLSDGTRVVMRSITLEAETIVVEEDTTIEVEANGGDVELAFLANTEFEVVIPEEAAWITPAEATRALESHTVALTVALNQETAERSAVVKVVAANESAIAVEYTIKQAGQPLPVLDAPVVTATVEGNVVTLAWEAVENAGSYSVTVGTEMPVITEELTYTFTGEYETEYTFNIVAIPADEEAYTASKVVTAVATTEAKPAQKVTVAEFLAAAEDSTMYELTGVITSVANTTYGNFDLTDETGTVYIYGLCSPEGAQKYWAESGAKLGDTITIQTARTSFNGAPQGKNALFVELVPFVETASEWGVVGDLNSWGSSADIVMYNTWKAKDLFVAYDVEIASGGFKIRANNEWNDAKNYGLEAAGQIYADKYYSLKNGGSSQNIIPMAYGTYDVYFDLANERVALVTPGKEYADAVDGGKPVVVIEGLTDHSWGLIGSFEGSGWSTDVEMTIEGDWAVAKNVQLANGNEFKFRADGSWDLSYGSACDVNVGETYTTYNNGGNMKFVGEAGAYNIYFSMIDASFYMETYISATTVEATMASFGFANAALVESVTLDENISLTFEKGGASTAPAYYTSGEAVRLYQNGAIMTVDANGRTISSIEITFANNMYYVAADSGELTEEAAVRTWTGSADKVKFTCTGTDKNTRAYIKAIKVTYE